MRTEHSLHVFEIEKEVNGVKKIFYFTTAEEPVTWRGKQYIPLSAFDADAWIYAPPPETT